MNAIIESAHAWQHGCARVTHFFGMLYYPNISPDFQQRLLHAAQIAHAIINNDNRLHSTSHWRITRITLRPQIVVWEDVNEARVRHLVEVAHRECFIANSLQTEVVVEPRISILD